ASSKRSTIWVTSAAPGRSAKSLCIPLHTSCHRAFIIDLHLHRFSPLLWTRRRGLYAPVHAHGRSVQGWLPAHAVSLRSQPEPLLPHPRRDRKSTRLNSTHT